jgi:hypothetical protein
VLNFGPQAICLRSKRVAQLNDVELTQRFPETPFASQGLSTIDAALRIAHDWERLSLHRITRADGNGRLTQPRRGAQRTEQNDGRDRNAGRDRGKPMLLAIRSSARIAPRGRRPARGPLTLRCWSHRIEAPKALQEYEREVVGAPLFDCTRQQFTCPLQIACLIRSDPLVQTLFGFALPLGKRAARAFDVRTSAPMATLEKGHPRPDIDRLFVITTEVVVETGQQQLFDTRGAFGLAQRASVGRISAEWLHADVIIGQELTLVNRFSPQLRLVWLYSVRS